MTALRWRLRRLISATYGACTGHSTSGMTCATRSKICRVSRWTSGVKGRSITVMSLSGGLRQEGLQTSPGVRGSMHPLCVFLLLGPVLRLGVFTPAASLLRTVQVINAGTEPVYSVRVGHRVTGQWSADLLDATHIIDV